MKTFTKQPNQQQEQRTQNAAKRPSGPLVGLLIATVLVGATALVLKLQKRKLPPQQELTPPNITSVGQTKTYNITSFTFTGKFLAPPKSLSVYTLSSEPKNSVQFAQELAEQLNLQPTDHPTIWSNDETLEGLNYSNVNKKIQYSVDIPPSSSTFTNESFASGLQNAQTFLDTIGYSGKTSPILEQITYFQDSEDLVETTKDQANIASVPFQYTLEGFPVYFDNNSLPLVTVWFNSDSRVVKAEFFTVPPTPESSSTRNTLLVEKALENLKSGKGAVISTQVLNQTYKLEDLVSAELQNVRIEYRYAEDASVYFPYYHFVGTGRVQTGGTIGLEVITPVVE